MEIDLSRAKKIAPPPGGIDLSRAKKISAPTAPTIEQKPVSSFPRRLAQGFVDPAAALQQMTNIGPRTLQYDPETESYTAHPNEVNPSVVQPDYVSPEGMDWARMAGNVANPITWAGPGGPARNLALTGAAQSVLAPVEDGADFWEEKRQQAVTGAVGAPLLSRVLRGFEPTKEARRLMDAGIQPTVGQGLNGVWNRTEQKLTSLPFVGDIIQHARQRPLKEFQQYVVNEAVGNPNLMRVPGVEVARNPSLGQANQYIDDLYNRSVPNLQSDPLTGIAPAFTASTQARTNAELTDTGRKIVESFNDRFAKVASGNLPGETLKALDTELGFIIRKYARSQSPADNAVADSLREVQQSYRTTMEAATRAAGDDTAADLLNMANEGYRNLVPINQAASARADNAIFPRALQKATARQRGTQTSKMPDDFLTAATHVLPSNYPDSGTAGRLLLALGAGGGATMIPGGVPGLVGASALTGAAYLRPVQKAMLGGYKMQQGGRPDDVARMTIAALRGDSPYTLDEEEP